MKEVTAPPKESEEDQEKTIRRKKTQLERYEIPIEHLDFRYIDKCTDAKEVEKIVKVLRSGEEGHFPDLEKCAINRLEKLDPKSKALRVEQPILRSEYLATKELDELKRNFLDWVDKIEADNTMDTLEDDETATEIFTELPSMEKVPIRSLETSTPGESSSIQKPNPDRIKSWEYDKWDKFDVDAELTKLEVESMQVEEWERSLDKKKLKEEQELVAKLMKNEDVAERKSKSVFSTTSSLRTKKVPAAVTKVVTSSNNNVPQLENAPLDRARPSSSNGSSSGIQGTSHEKTRPLIQEVTTKTEANLSTPSSQKAQRHSKSSKSVPLKHDSNSLPSEPTRKTLGRSFIEELSDDTPKASKQTNPKSRFRIQIEDLHIA